VITAAGQAAAASQDGSIFAGLAVITVIALVWKYSLPGKDGKGISWWCVGAR